MKDKMSLLEINNCAHSRIWLIQIKNRQDGLSSGLPTTLVACCPHLTSDSPGKVNREWPLYSSNGLPHIHKVTHIHIWWLPSITNTSTAGRWAAPLEQ